MSFLAELKHRNVFRVAVAYVVAAWVIMQFSALILDIYDSPEWVIQAIVALLALGLPFALVFAWAFEVTPEGIKRESEVTHSRSNTQLTAKKLDVLTIAMVVMAFALFSIDRLLRDKYDGATVAAVNDTDPEPGVAWVTKQLREIDRLRDLGRFGDAFALATELEPSLDSDLVGDDYWAGFSWSADIETIPPGAKVYRQPVDESEDKWEELGTTPLESVRFAENEGYRLRFELDGYRPVELLQSAVREFPWPGFEKPRPVRLDPLDALPEEMVRVKGFTNDLVEYDDFFMDRFEVTNRDYERFVASGGYETPDYWTEPFVRDGKEIPWEEAMTRFVDRTGRPGPSTWTGGAYPDGQGDYPVSGVSWYEAAAYARSVGKELPTTAHFERAGNSYFFDAGYVASLSNLGGDGPRPVGKNRAMTTLGIYDLVGNVREWCWNEAGEGTRGTRGASWTDATFLAWWIIPKSPWDRDVTHGFRLIRTFDSSEKIARLRRPDEPKTHIDLRDYVPVSDEVFNAYRRMYAYDPAELNAEVVEIEDFEHWTRERVEFDLPYGERGGVYLFVPKHTHAPYEPVIYWGGNSLLFYRSVDEDVLEFFRFIMRSGRIVAAPIFKGSFDRSDATLLTMMEEPDFEASTTHRDYQIRWVQDVSRTIDYLETRDDIDSERIGFYGLSWGAAVAPIVLAIEDRIDVAVLNVGGLRERTRNLPEADPITFVSRVYAPVLMINGEYDIVFPLETSQKPMFELLGTDPADKKHVVSPSGHIAPRDVVIRESLAWFDRYLSD